MPLTPTRYDPTRLTTVRRIVQTELSKRYNLLKKKVIQHLNNLPDTYQFLTPTNFIAEFMKWFDYQIEQTIFRPHKWWDKYVQQIFFRGLGRAYDTIRHPNLSNPVDVALRREFIRGVASRTQAVSSESTIRNARENKPQPRDTKGRFITERMHLLSLRLESEITGATKQLSQVVAREILDGLSKGHKPSTIARDITKKIDVSKSRAFAIARTEITRIHAEGQLDGLEELGVDEVQAEAEWISGSGNPCPLCQPMVGAVLTIREARGLIPRHVSCYCAWLPIVDGKVKGARSNSKLRRSESPKTTKRAIRSAARKSIKAEGGASKSDWDGTDLVGNSNSNTNHNNDLTPLIELSNWIHRERINRGI